MQEGPGPQARPPPPAARPRPRRAGGPPPPPPPGAPPFTFPRGTSRAPAKWGSTPFTAPAATGSVALDPGGAMRIMKFIFTLAAAMALAGCIFHSTRAGHGSSHPGKGPPPGHGWRK